MHCGVDGPRAAGEDDGDEGGVGGRGEEGEGTFLEVTLAIQLQRERAEVERDGLHDVLRVDARVVRVL